MHQGSALEIPKVDWLDRSENPDKFFKDLTYALSDFGFMVLTNAPGLADEFQQRAFKEVRGFFDSPMDVKKTAHISTLPTSEVIVCQLQRIVVWTSDRSFSI